MSIIETGAVVLLVLIYGGSGIVELPQWRKFSDQFARWGYPAWFSLFIPALKVFAGVLTAVPPTRSYGVVLCVVVAVGALVTVLRFKERVMYKAAIPVVALTLLSAAWLLA
jgi:hypothetical protein